VRHPIWVLLCLVSGIAIAGSIALAAPSRTNLDRSQGVVAATNGQLAISDVRVTSLTDSTAKMSWTTNIAATGQVTYSASGSNPQIVSDVHPDSSTSNTTHLVTLSGLTASQTYSFSIQSSDTVGENASTSSQTFTTGPILGAPSTYSTLFTALSSTGNPVPNALLFFSTQDSTNGTSETWAGMTDANGDYRLVLPLRTQALSGYVSGTPATLTITGVDSSGNTATATLNLTNLGSLPATESITFPITAPTTITTILGPDTIQVSVPQEAQPIVQLAVSTPTTPPAITPIAQDQQIFAVQIDATGANGPIHTLSAPLQISITFRPALNINPLLAQIYTIDNGQTQALATRVTNNGDGTFTATALTTHLSPFVVEAPGVGTPIPEAYVSLALNNRPGGGW